MNKKKEYRTEVEEPSEIFLNAVMAKSGRGAGSDEMTCGWCDRDHLCPDNEYAEQDPMDRDAYRKYCEEEKKKNSDGVVLHYNCDSVSGYEFNGILFVLDCPCNGLIKYERFIWAEKDTIREYLSHRIKREFQLAEQQLTINKLTGIPV